MFKRFVLLFLLLFSLSLYPSSGRKRSASPQPGLLKNGTFVKKDELVNIIDIVHTMENELVRVRLEDRAKKSKENVAKLNRILIDMVDSLGKDVDDQEREKNQKEREVIARLIINYRKPGYLYGSTALHIASEFGDLDMVDNLLKLGADPSIRDDDGDIPRHGLYQVIQTKKECGIDMPYEKVVDLLKSAEKKKNRAKKYRPNPKPRKIDAKHVN